MRWSSYCNLRFQTLIFSRPSRLLWPFASSMNTRSKFSPKSSSYLNQKIRILGETVWMPLQNTYNSGVTGYGGPPSLSSIGNIRAISVPPGFTISAMRALHCGRISGGIAHRKLYIHNSVRRWQIDKSCTYAAVIVDSRVVINKIVATLWIFKSVKICTDKVKVPLLVSVLFLAHLNAFGNKI